MKFASRDENPLDVTFNQMSGAIGSLILIWSRIERSARDDVVRLLGFLPARAHGIKGVIGTWEDAVVEAQPADTLCVLLAATLRSQLQGRLDIRNGICHGLIGIMGSVGEAPATLSWELNGLKQSISWEELQSSLGWLSKIHLAFSIISNPALDRPGLSTLARTENGGGPSLVWIWRNNNRSLQYSRPANSRRRGQSPKAAKDLANAEPAVF